MPNDLYRDPGVHPFQSSVWRSAIPHKVRLMTVLRQDDMALYKSISELERGYPSSSTIVLMNSLDRPLSLPPGEKAVILYGTNFEADCQNSSELQV